MTKRNSIGTAIGLALCIAVVPACSKGGTSSNQAVSNAAGPGAPVQVQWNAKLEKQLREAIANAPANGLKPELFLKGNEDGAALTDAALRYAEALAHGYADPSKLGEIYTIPRASADVRQGFVDAAQKGDLKDWLNSLPPQTDEYKALSQAHLHYLQLAARPKPQPIPDGKPIKPSRGDKRIPLVAAALNALGYLQQRPPQNGGGARAQAAAPAAHPAAYTPQLVAGVKKVQSEFGLQPDGVINGATVDALNADPSWRARELAIAMERLRWLPRDPPPTRIDVNTAATFLDYWRDGQHLDHRKVVAGEPDKPTPQIQGEFHQLVANPYWRIPDSIYKEELADKGSAYFAKNNMVFQNGKLVQLPGPKNSLGLVKFDVDDPQDIYLHDTPAKALFALPHRHRSHGCVRVENAIDFATTLASQDGVEDKFQEAMAGGDEKYVRLKTKFVVRTLYQTAFWDGSQIGFRPDVYGWDDDVAQALGLIRGPARPKYQPQAVDIGP